MLCLRPFVGYIATRRAGPSDHELVVISDSFVLAEHVGEVGANDFIGEESDLFRNWNALLDAAGLST